MGLLIGDHLIPMTNQIPYWDGTRWALQDKGFINEVTSDPAADAAHLGQIIRIRAAAGNKTYIKICVQNDADGYEWVQIAVST